jgi:hypothetical protein
MLDVPDTRAMNDFYYFENIELLLCFTLYFTIIIMLIILMGSINYYYISCNAILMFILITQFLEYS